ncbi:MAG: hypothetical protein AAFQ78_02275, partial [Bacteroidota bacterium]
SYLASEALVHIILQAPYASTPVAAMTLAEEHKKGYDEKKHAATIPPPGVAQQLTYELEGQRNSTAEAPQPYPSTYVQA